ncbi:hypothetical protein [Thalassovita litoralis]|nr:hypothetical protein [Thalassovita litoralis]
MTDDLGGVDRLSYSQRSLVERALWIEHWIAQQERELAEGRIGAFDAGRWTQATNSLLRDDAARASAEYLAQFRSDVEQFIAQDQVQAAQRSKPLELPRQEGIIYTAFVDPGGGGKDEYTLAIGHREGDRLVVDLVHGRKGNPAAITADYAKTLKSYGIFRVAGDRYAGAWVPTEFSRHGITYEPAPGTRSELYASFAPALNSGVVELPACDVLERQLVALERRTTRGGRDIIDHAPGAHDDRANAVAGVVAQLAKKRSDQVFGVLDYGYSHWHPMGWASRGMVQH